MYIARSIISGTASAQTASRWLARCIQICERRFTRIRSTWRARPGTGFRRILTNEYSTGNAIYGSAVHLLNQAVQIASGLADVSFLPCSGDFTLDRDRPRVTQRFQLSDYLREVDATFPNCNLFAEFARVRRV